MFREAGRKIQCSGVEGAIENTEDPDPNVSPDGCSYLEKVERRKEAAQWLLPNRSGEQLDIFVLGPSPLLHASHT